MSNFKFEFDSSIQLFRYSQNKIKWFQPDTPREHCYLYFSNPKKQIKGAFIVRKSSNSINYCITILTEAKNWPDNSAFKHILIHLGVDDKYRICLDERVYSGQAYTQYNFDSIYALVSFYKENSIGLHYKDFNGKLVDVFSDTSLGMGGIAPTGLVLPETGQKKTKISDKEFVELKTRPKFISTSVVFRPVPKARKRVVYSRGNRSILV